MKKQIYDIVFEAQYQGLTTKEATDKLLLLFSVSGQSEQLNAFLSYIQQSEKEGETIVNNDDFIEGYLKSL